MIYTILFVILMASLIFCSLKFSLKIKTPKLLNILFIVALSLNILEIAVRFGTVWYICDGAVEFRNRIHFDVEEVKYLIPNIISSLIIILLFFTHNQHTKLTPVKCTNTVLGGLFVSTVAKVIIHYGINEYLINVTTLLHAIPPILLIVAMVMFIQKSPKAIPFACIATSTLIYGCSITPIVSTHVRHHLVYYIEGEGFHEEIITTDRIYICNLIDILTTILIVLIVVLAIKNLRLLNSKTHTAESTEQQLLTIKDNLNLGIITKDEYEAQRSDIISKL